METNVSVVGLGGDPVCEVRASTVRELKQEIERVNGVAAFRQQICCGEQHLHDKDKLCTLASGGSLVVQFVYRPWSDEEIEKTTKRVRAALRDWYGGPPTQDCERAFVAILKKVGNDDVRVGLAAVQQNGHALKYFHQVMKNHVDVVMAAVQQNWRALEHAGEVMKNDVTIVRAAVQQNWRALGHAGEGMKNDATIVKAAVQQNGCALKHAGEGMKNDVTIVRAAVQQDWRALEHAGEEMKNDVTIVRTAVQQDGHRLPASNDKHV